MYEQMGNACRKSLKRQFDFSRSELDQMEKFISDNMDKTAKEILDMLMEDASLNDKQKVIVSYTLGASIGSEDTLQNMKKNTIQNVERMNHDMLSTNIRIGQGG